MSHKQQSEILQGKSGIESLKKANALAESNLPGVKVSLSSEIKRIPKRFLVSHLILV